MQREESSIPTGTGDDIFSFATEFEDPVVRKYAAALRNADVSLKSFDRPTIAEELVRAGIPEIPAGDIVDAFRAYRRRGRVGVYWDIENIPLPREVDPVMALKALRDKILDKLGDIVEFKAYMDMQQFVQMYPPEVRIAFLDCGIQLIDAPHNDRKEVADKQIIVDAMWFTARNKDPIVCLMSGDSDFSPLLSKFRMDGIRSMVITSKHHVRSLREQATWVLVWPHHFLDVPVDVDPGQQRNRRNPIVRQGFVGRGAGASPPAYRSTGGAVRQNQSSVSPSSRRNGPFYSRGGNHSHSPYRQTSSPSKYVAGSKNNNNNKQFVAPSRGPQNDHPQSTDPEDDEEYEQEGDDTITAEEVPANAATLPPKNGTDSGNTIPSTNNNNNNQKEEDTAGSATTATEDEQQTAADVPPSSVPHRPFLEDDDDDTVDDPVQRDLLECIRRVQRETGMQKVRRSAVGVYFGKLTKNMVTMRDAVGAALAAQRVVVGGRMGHAWIALTSDGVNDDDPNMTLPVSEVSSVAGDDVAVTVAAHSDWYLSLRYSRKYRAFGELSAFTVMGDPVLRVIRMQEPNGMWTRMAVGPFTSMQAADDYFQSHFSGMDILYKVTNNLPMYYAGAQGVPTGGQQLLPPPPPPPIH